MGGAINITPRSQQNLWKQIWDIARDGAVPGQCLRYACFICRQQRSGVLQVSGSQLKQDFLGLPHGVNMILQANTAR